MQVGSRTIPRYTPVGDYQCAMIGTLLQQAELSLNLSAGSQVGLRAQVRRHDVSERTHRRGFRHQTRIPRSWWREDRG